MSEKMSECSTDFLATELLAELKQENARKTALVKKLVVSLISTFVVALITILAVVGAFIWYFNQYDFISEQTVSGTYALVDSSGNVIASDVPEEYLDQIIGAE